MKRVSKKSQRYIGMQNLFAFHDFLIANVAVPAFWFDLLQHAQKKSTTTITSSICSKERSIPKMYHDAPSSSIPKMEDHNAP
jgi:hypothetical protein